MIIVWDEPKRLANIDKHGIDFADIPLEFFETALIGMAKGSRWFALGQIGMAVVVIFVVLGSEGISIVSARPASRRERMAIK